MEFIFPTFIEVFTCNPREKLPEINSTLTYPSSLSGLWNGPRDLKFSPRLANVTSLEG